MSQVALVLVTALMTLVGVIIAKMLERFFIEPLKEFFTIRRQIGDAVMRHWGLGGAWANEDGDLCRDDPKELKRAARKVRALVAAIRASVSDIPFYRIWVRLFGLPTREAVKRGTGALEMWSHAIIRDYSPSTEYLDKADAALKLRVMWFYDHTGRPDPADRPRPKKWQKRDARPTAKAAS